MAEEQNRSTGVVKWFSIQKGFGFITPSDGSEDLFVHQSSIRSQGFRSLSEGEEVEFTLDLTDDGRRKAVDVSGPAGSPVRTATAAGRGGYYGGRGGRRGGYSGYGGYAGGYGEGYGRYGEGYRRGGRSSGRGGGGGGYSAGAGGGGVACFNCGRIGHLARDCYRGFRRGRGGSGGGGGGCYNCGRQGHFARECPNVQN